MLRTHMLKVVIDQGSYDGAISKNNKLSTSDTKTTK